MPTSRAVESIPCTVESDSLFASAIDAATVRHFGDEWQAFDQSALDDATLRRLWDEYFAEFPWDLVRHDAVGVDVGCGSGRWAKFVAPRCGTLWCVDPSPQALEVAQRTLASCDNTQLMCGAAGALPFAAERFDFAYALGVLHHTPDPQRALADCVRTLKPGAPMLVYLYYAMDSRPGWFRGLWRISEAFRRLLARSPFRVRYLVSQAIAVLVYFPLARGSRFLARAFGVRAESVPLSTYGHAPLYVMRNDALDRFGTAVEHRFTAREVVDLMERAGLVDVRLNPARPYWCAVGLKPGAPLSWGDRPGGDGRR